uniref:PRA1 family protein n=1 Tax=Panagrellus redivivus TaxID=6233 RepID=A0A7E4US32_PANRE
MVTDAALSDRAQLTASLAPLQPVGWDRLRGQHEDGLRRMFNFLNHSKSSIAQLVVIGITLVNVRLVNFCGI